MTETPIPLAMLAELTHRCPLKCPYCSNPLDLVRRSEEIPSATWLRVFAEAAAMGVLQLHLSGGEPAARDDLEVLIAGAARAGLYTNLVTSGIGLGVARVAALAEAGLDHVQLSVQGPDAALSDAVGGLAGAFETKRAVAAAITAAGLPLTVNAVLHRGNLDRVAEIVALAEGFGARRLELAHTQYHGWAARNRSALMPSRAQAKAAAEVAATARARLRGRMAIDYVPPDHLATYPKACMGGWGRTGFCVAPDGTVLPCHAAQTLPGLVFETVDDRPLAEIWANGAAFVAYRGTDWMPEPCRSCARKTVDWGGCRCQAFALTGDAGATDPVCEKSPARPMVDAALVDAPADPIPRSYANARSA